MEVVCVFVDVGLKLPQKAQASLRLAEKTLGV